MPAPMTVVVPVDIADRMCMLGPLRGAAAVRRSCDPTGGKAAMSLGQGSQVAFQGPATTLRCP